MPSIFLCHGAPYLAIQDTDYTRSLNQLGKTLGKPKAILLFSAHYESRDQLLTSTDEEYETIYDFSGFPGELYEIRYPAKGSTDMAGKIQSLLADAGIPSAADTVRGLDHGAWVLLRHLYPDADVPVIAASINRQLSPQEQYALGKAVSRLKQEDVLIIASGGTSHNLRMIEWDATKPAEWTVKFDDWLLEKISAWDQEALFDYRNLAPYADWAVPPYGNEHFVPIFIAMGAGDDVKKATVLQRGYELGTLSLIGLQFG